MSAQTVASVTLLRQVEGSESESAPPADSAVAGLFSNEPSDPGFRVRKGVDGSVDVSGEVDFLIGQSFQKALSASIPPSGTAIISLRGLQFIDSTGIRAIVSTAGSFPMVEFRLISAKPSFVRYWELLTCHSRVSNVKLEPITTSEGPGAPELPIDAGKPDLSAAM